MHACIKRRRRRRGLNSRRSLNNRQQFQLFFIMNCRRVVTALEFSDGPHMQLFAVASHIPMILTLLHTIIQYGKQWDARG